MMRSFVKKLWSMLSHVQVLSVFFAFAMMVFLSYSFMSDIERKHLLDKVYDAIRNTQGNIAAELLESETTLGIISETVCAMISSGGSYEMIEDHLTHVTGYLLSDTHYVSTSGGVYCYFDVFGGKFYDGLSRVTPDDFDPKNTAWYSAAVEANGRVAQLEPEFVIDAASGVYDVVITFARRIFSHDGIPLGIVCMDIKIDKIQEYAINTYVTEGSYGILFDKALDVIAHPIPERFIGKNIALMNDGEEIKKILTQGGKIFERKVWDYNRNESVGFFHALENGWCIAIVAYADKYYQSLTRIGYILSALGLFFALALSAILLYVVAEKKKAEERTKIMLDTTPLCANFWNTRYKNIDCNQEAMSLFEISGKNEYLNRYDELSPEYQPDGKLSYQKKLEFIKKAFNEGYCRFEWTHRKLSGELIPCEITLVRVKFRNDYIVCGYTRDLREMKAIMTKMREADACTQVLFDATPLSCFMLDKHLKVLESNQEIARLFGLENKKEFIENIFSFFPRYQPSGELSEQTFKNYLYEAFDEGFSRFEWVHQKLDGEQIPTEISLVRVKFKGEYAIAG